LCPENRAYIIRLSQDLLEDWIITLINGRIKSKLGQSRTIAFASFSEAFDHLCALAKVRFQRGYQPQKITIDSYLLLHLLPFMTHVAHNSEFPALTIIKNKKSGRLLSKTSPALSSQQLGFAF
jgi:hypothetical protein